MTSDKMNPLEMPHSEASDYESPKRTRKLKKKKKSLGWSTQDYNELISLVRKYGEEWETISKLLNNKTPKQCMQKFKNSQRSAKKGNWTEEENQILLNWVKKNGPTKWTECSKFL
jgi:hypothetical protein